MKNKKIMIISIITFALVLLISVTYAVYMYRQTGTNNNQVVLGDIYVHYQENNQLILSDTDITDANTEYDGEILSLNYYKVNPVMASQTYEENELSKCVSYFNTMGITEVLDEGSTAVTFCQGTGTFQGGTTIQTLIGTASDEYIQEMLSLNIIVQDGENYIVNPIMASQTLPENDNELSACVDYLTSAGMPLKSGSMKDFCQGTGTAQNGYTFQQNLDTGNWFPEEILQEMESQNIVIANEIEYSKFGVNPVMANQSMNELSSCVSYFNAMGIIAVLDEGSTAVTFCQGTGTVQGGTTIQALIESVPDTNIQDMLSLNIIVASDDSYVVNSVMQTQSLEENELYKCIIFVNDMGLTLDDGSDSVSFCKGTGTSEGLTFQEYIDKEQGNEYFLESEGMSLLSSNVIVPIIEENPYFEFTISGKNTYSKEDIYYDIILNHGDNHETRTERIRDDLLRFSLVKIVDDEETVVFENMSYDDLNNRKILTETISKNTMEEVNIKYRLYMGFYEGIKVGVVGPNSNKTVDYDFDTWNNEVYASIKVNVKGGLK